MNIAYRFRIYPNREQEVLLAKTFGCCRFLYNQMLNDKIREYEASKKMLRNTPAMYKKAYPFLKEVDSLALANVQLHLESAFRKFFREPSCGFPRYKSKKRAGNSYTTNAVNGNIFLQDTHLKLPKMSSIKIKLHRQIPSDWKLKSVTVSREPSGKYFAVLNVEFEPEPRPNQGGTIGIDVGIKAFYSDSNGNTVSNPRYLERSMRKLIREQRRLSRKQKDSHNRGKQRLRVARVHEKIANQRNDFLQKQSTMLVRENQTICIEDLNVKGMIRNHKLAKSIASVSWAKFFEMLEYKASWYGNELHRIPTMYPSSQTCSSCGYRNPRIKNLSIRIWECPKCHAVHDRDTNAGINILKKALQMQSA